MLAWLFMCNAIIKYANIHVREIITEEGKIPLDKVLKYYVDENPNNADALYLYQYLKAYYISRCNVFKRDLEKGDKLSEHDIANDKKFDFTFNNKKIID